MNINDNDFIHDFSLKPDRCNSDSKIVSINITLKGEDLITSQFYNYKR